MHGSFTGPRRVEDTADALLIDISGQSVAIPDAQLLSGDFSRSGDSLKIVGSDGKTVVVVDYFKADRLATLIAPDGIALAGDIVATLAGPRAPNQYAQAGAPSGGGQPQIGAVDKMSGNVTVIRNGASVTLNAGDAILKSDIVQTGANSTVAIIMVDGTALNLGQGTRMAMSEFNYDANSTTNSSLLNLLQGSFVSLSGAIAKTGGLNIETPVATMGVRGTFFGADCGGRCEFFAQVDPRDQTQSTYTLMTGGQMVNGQYVGGTVLGTVTIQVNTIIAPTLSGQAPIISTAPAGNNQQLANLGAQLAQIFQSMVVPTPPAQAPAGPDPAAGPGQGTTPQGGGPSGGSSTSPQLLASTGPQTPPADVPPPKQVVVTLPTETGTVTVVFTPVQPPPVVVVPPTALPPVVANGIVAQTSPEDTAWNFTIPSDTFTDADTASLTLVATLSNGAALPDWLSFSNGTFHGTPPENTTGVVPIQVIATDGTSSAAVAFTLTISNVNDAPVLTLSDNSIGAHVNTPETLLGATVTDPDFGDLITLTISVEHGTLSGNGALPPGVEVLDDDQDNDGILSIRGSVADINTVLVSGAIYTPDHNYSGPDTLTVIVADAAGSSVTRQASISVGNEEPEISGLNSGTVHEDAPVALRAVSGQLTATDADGDTVEKWTVDGGNDPEPVDYTFRMDRFHIEASGGFNFTDEFNDGNPPPSGPTGSPPIYGLTSGATISESGGFAVLNSTGAATLTGVGTATPLVGQYATVQTPTSALTKQQDFTVEGRFDLIRPDDIREGYGVRLTDGSGPGTGNDGLELIVIRGNSGSVVVQLRHLDFTPGGVVTPLESIVLTTSPNETQIVLRLVHEAGSSEVHAEFDLYNLNGSFNRTVELAHSGEIFHGEDFTRAGFFALAPNPTLSFVQGTYGTLAVDKNGLWTYGLANGSAAVQGLNEGQIEHEHFTVLADDGHGGVGEREITIEVVGHNDAPTLALGGTLAEDQFATQSYDGWTETGDNFGGATNNDPTEGEIQLTPAAGGGFELRLTDNDGEQASPDTVQRSFDLSGSTSAWLTFQYRRDIANGQIDDQVLVQVSSNGGAFGTIDNIGATGTGSFVDGNYQTFSLDLTQYISANTVVRFSVGDLVDNGDVVYVDNIRITGAEDRAATYTENGAPVPIGFHSNIGDSDDSNTESATIVLTNKQAGDFLALNGTQLFDGDSDDVGSIGYTVTDNGSSITISLLGAASRAAYQDFIDSITFASSSENPSTVGRTVNVTVNDGSDSSNTATTTIAVVAVDAPEPSINNLGPPASSQEQVFGFLDTNVTVSDAQLDALFSGSGNYAGASLVIQRHGGANVQDAFDFNLTGSNGLTVVGDELRNVGGTIKVATFSNPGDGTLTIEFEGINPGIQVLRSVVNDIIQHITYHNASDTPPGSVALDYTFSDGTHSATETLTVNITPVNDAPEVVQYQPIAAVLDVDFSNSFGYVGYYYGGNTETGDIVLTQRNEDGSPAGGDYLRIQSKSTLGDGGNYGGVLGTFWDQFAPQQQADAYYRISYYARAVEGDGHIFFSHQDGPGNDSPLAHGVTLTDDWQYFEHIAQLDAPRSTFYFYATDPDLQWDLDGYRFEQIEWRAVSTDEDTPVTLSNANDNAIVIFDADSNSLEVTLTATSTLTLASTDGLTFSDGDGCGDSTMTFTGSKAAVNAALDGLVYTPDENFNGDGSIEYSVDDGDDITSGVITVHVASVNDDPELFVEDATRETGHNTDLVISGPGISLVDVDTGDLITLLLSVTEGTLTSNEDLPGDVEVIDSGDTFIRVEGSVADLNTFLTDGVTYSPDDGFSGTVTLTIRATDSQNSDELGTHRDHCREHRAGGELRRPGRAAERAGQRQLRTGPGHLRLLRAAVGRIDRDHRLDGDLRQHRADRGAGAAQLRLGCRRRQQQPRPERHYGRRHLPELRDAARPAVHGDVPDGGQPGARQRSRPDPRHDRGRHWQRCGRLPVRQQQQHQPRHGLGGADVHVPRYGYDHDAVLQQPGPLQLRTCARRRVRGAVGAHRCRRHADHAAVGDHRQLHPVAERHDRVHRRGRGRRPGRLGAVAVD